LITSVKKINKCSLCHCRPLLQKNLGRGSPFNVSYQNCCKKKHICQWFSKFSFCIILRGKISYLLGSNKDLQPFADQEAVDQSTLYTMPDLFPVDPTIDLIKEHIYTDTIDTGKVV
jgi:hypothetical protein